MDDLKPLNGHWAQTHVNEDGIESTSEDIGLNSITEFLNGAFKVRSSTGEILLEGEYTLDPQSNPPAIDWTDYTGEDKTFFAIYNLSHDEFDFVAANEKMDRPKSFVPQRGHTIRRFRKMDK